MAQIRAKEAKYVICSANNNNSNSNSNSSSNNINVRNSSNKNCSCVSLLGIRICGARYVNRHIYANQSISDKYIDNVNTNSRINSNKNK